ncbi:MAG: GAF domain-containing protein, partial [bacterium]
MNSKDELETLNRSLHELQALNKLAQAISSTTDIDTLINTIIKAATELCQARQGSILLTKENSEHKFTTLIRKGTKKHESLVQKMCMVIAGWVLKKQESLLV